MLSLRTNTNICCCISILLETYKSGVMACSNHVLVCCLLKMKLKHSVDVLVAG